MSDVDIGYVPYRVSMKQEKLYKATSEIARMRAEIYKSIKQVKGLNKRETLHDAKEILSGVIMPGRKW